MDGRALAHYPLLWAKPYEIGSAMHREIWSDLATFFAVAENGSFTRAAAALGVSPSAVSHAMRVMEERMAVRLFNRTTRSIALTEAGERLMATLRPAMADLDETVRTLELQGDRPVGRVRVSAHRTAAAYAVLPHMAKFAEAYPEVSVELVVDDGLVDIVAGRFDAGIRRRKELEPDMISVKLDDGVRLAYVAAPTYLAAAGEIRTPADLLNHRCVNYRYASSGAIHRWPFEREGETILVDAPGNLITSDGDILLEAALRGCGVACLTETHVAPHLGRGTLTRVLEDCSPNLPPNYLYYPGRRQVRPALRAFIDALTSRSADGLSRAR